MRFSESFILFCSNFLHIFNILHSWHTIENFIQEKLEYLTSLYTKKMKNDNDDLKFSIDPRHSTAIVQMISISVIRLQQHYPLEKVYRPQSANYRGMEII